MRQKIKTKKEKHKTSWKPTKKRQKKTKPQKNLVQGMLVGRPVWEIWILVGPQIEAKGCA
jgi:hypothetical protein